MFSLELCRGSQCVAWSSVVKPSVVWSSVEEPSVDWSSVKEPNVVRWNKV